MKLTLKNIFLLKLQKKYKYKKEILKFFIFVRVVLLWYILLGWVHTYLRSNPGVRYECSTLKQRNN